MAGSHGSLTKAGKVRNQTPKVEGRKRKGLTPILRNKKNYIKRIVRDMPVGQPEFRQERRR
ncbi:30S ribosomal protein S30 [Candidatus Heimdallarchaeota archaeon B3_Heim]|nr:MAG: 30S ribosomal protein S30 [Candidatus Heimdallarchaeota archaeon B3_Heim]